MIRNFRILTAASLVWGAFFCVGMGMEMGPSQPRVKAKAHACCPKAPSKKKQEPSGPDCCSFIPGAVVAKAALPTPPRTVSITVSRAVPADSAAVEPVSSSRAPPGDAPSLASASSPRAPPAA